MSKKKHLQHRLDSLFNELETREQAPFPSIKSAGQPIWNWVVDDQGIYISVSPEVTQSLGIQHANFEGKSIFSYAITHNSGKRLRDLFNKMQFPAEMDVYFQSAEGVFIPTHIQVFYSKPDNGNPASFRGYAQVLSENFIEPPLENALADNIEITVSNRIVDQPTPQIIPDQVPVKTFAYEQSISEAGRQSLIQNKIITQPARPDQPATLALPVDLKENGTGILELIDQDPERSWTEDDYLLAQEVAQQLALAIENARLYEAAQKELHERMRAQQEIIELNKDLASLNQFGQQLNRYTDPRQILDLTRKMIRQVVKSGHLTIARLSSDQVDAPFSQVIGDSNSGEPLGNTEDNLLRFVIRQQKPLFLNSNIQQKLHTLNLETTGVSPECLLAIPVLSGQKTLGAILLLDHQDPDAFSQTDLDLLSTIASQTASALENASLFQEIRSALAVIESREQYQSNIAQAVAVLTKFGSNSLREVLDFIGRAALADRVFYAQIREESINPYWHQTAEWTKQENDAPFPTNPRGNIKSELFNQKIHVLREQGWFIIHADEAEDPLRHWMDHRQTRTILVLAVPVKSSIPSIIVVEDCLVRRDWRSEEIGFLRVATDALSNTFIREELVDQLQVTLDETENLYNASNQLSLANTFQEMLQALTHGLFIPDINRSILTIYANDKDDQITEVRVAASWHNGVGTPPPANGTLFDLAIYQDFLSPESPVYIDDIYYAGLSHNLVQLLENQKVRSLAVLPLFSGKRRIGTILLESENRHTFTNREKRTFPPLLDQMATAVENQHLLEQTRESLQETELLYRISEGITTASDHQSLIDIVAENIMPENAETAALFLLHPSSSQSDPGSLELVGFHPKQTDQPKSPLTLSAELFPALKLLRTSPSLVIEDILESHLDDVTIQTLQRKNIKGGVIVPLMSGGQLVGLLTAYSSHRFTIDPDESRMMQVAGNGIAVVLERQRLLDDTRQRALELQTAAEIARDTTSTLSLDKLLSRIVNLITQRFHFLHTAIYLIEDTGFAVIRESAGKSIHLEERENKKVQVGSSTAIGSAASSGEVIVINDMQTELDISEKSHLHGTRSEICLPLVTGSRIIGVLDIHSEKSNAFSSPEITVLQILADQIAVAIQNARAYEISQQAIEDMREIDRIKSQFLANMSHELRTPLNSIIGFSRVILKGIDGPINETQEQDLTAIYNSGQHLLRLINDILDLSKIEAGKMQLQKTETNIADLVNSVMSTAIGLVKDKPIKLEYHVPEGLPLIMVDQTRIRQVLLNFLSNAAKFTECGQIIVEASAITSPNGKPEIMVTVSDTGTGIAESDRSKLFQPFSQVDDSPTRKTGGTGLGLSICRSFIEMHDGRIGLLASEIDKGSSFFFTLPIHDVVEEIIADIDETPVSDKTILSIDDDRQITDLYEWFLSSNGYRVIALNNPGKAVRLAKEVQPFAITLDIMMPGKDGWQVIQDLKNDPETKNIPVIICSILEEEEKGFNLGAADYLIKPFLQEDLVQAVQRLNFAEQVHSILVIDDDPDDRDLIARVLNDRQKFDVRFASNAEEGLSSLRQDLPDLVILDLVLPGKNGFDVLDEINASPELAHLPIIILASADITPDQFNRLNLSGQQLLLKGLVGEKELITTLENALKQTHPPS